jgi:hypothetical protein
VIILAATRIMRGGSEQQWRVISQQVLHNIARSEDRCQKRLSLENLRLGERYVEGKLNILVRFKVPFHGKDRIALLGGQQIAATGMKPCGSLRQGMTQFNVAGKESFQDSAASLNSEVTYADSGDYQEAVLIDIVKLIESPERTVPSLVRLGSPQRIFDSLNDGLHFSFRFGHILLETLKVFEDREGRPLFRLGPRSAANLNELPPQIVESASQIVGSIAIGEQNLLGNIPPLVQKPDSDILFDIILGNSCIGLRAEELNPFEIEFTDVLFGPFDF